jgi:hypothetical protein
MAKGVELIHEIKKTTLVAKGLEVVEAVMQVMHLMPIEANSLQQTIK